MKYIDVTLRDGGHQHGFNWPLEFVKRYLESLNLFPEIEFVELGYWKQSDKFDGPFYSMDEKLLSSHDKVKIPCIQMRNLTDIFSFDSLKLSSHGFLQLQRFQAILQSPIS